MSTFFLVSVLWEMVHSISEGCNERKGLRAIFKQWKKHGTFMTTGGTDCLWLCLGKFLGNTVSCDYYYKLWWYKACSGFGVFLMGDTEFHILSVSLEFMLSFCISHWSTSRRYIKNYRITSKKVHFRKRKMSSSSKNTLHIFKYLN